MSSSKVVVVIEVELVGDPGGAEVAVEGEMGDALGLNTVVGEEDSPTLVVVLEDDDPGLVVDALRSVVVVVDEDGPTLVLSTRGMLVMSLLGSHLWVPHL